MRLLIFLQGTVIMHKNGLNKTRDERVQQVKNKDTSIFEYDSYVPIDQAFKKLRTWQKHGTTISYLSARKTKQDMEEDKKVLEKYYFPKGEIFYRKDGKSYKNIVEEITPDLLIEDDCESIGGRKSMSFTYVNSILQNKIKSIVVKEFGGIDHLPDRISDLLAYEVSKNRY